MVSASRKGAVLMAYPEQHVVLPTAWSIGRTGVRQLPNAFESFYNRQLSQQQSASYTTSILLTTDRLSRFAISGRLARCPTNNGHAL